MEDIEHKVIIMESGEQIPVTSSLGTIVSFYIGADRPKETITLDVTEKEFETMRKQAIKNRIPRATLMSKRKSDT